MTPCKGLLVRDFLRETPHERLLDRDHLRLLREVSCKEFLRGVPREESLGEPLVGSLLRGLPREESCVRLLARDSL